jgi:hypothetical protein
MATWSDKLRTKHRALHGVFSIPYGGTDVLQSQEAYTLRLTENRLQAHRHFASQHTVPAREFTHGDPRANYILIR